MTFVVLGQIEVADVFGDITTPEDGLGSFGRLSLSGGIWIMILGFGALR